MTLDPLLAISAVDGRYRAMVEPLAPIVSEYGLMKARVEVECKWLEALSAAPEVAELPALESEQRDAVAAIHANFSASDARRIKNLEAVTNHDVKAVETVIAQKRFDSSLDERRVSMDVVRKHEHGELDPRPAMHLLVHG